VHALRDAHGLASDAADRVQQKRYLDSLRATLGDESFQMAWEAGRDQPLDVAIAEALALSVTGPEDVLPLIETLSNREREIAERIYHGLTNQQIAAELGISKRTVDTHVSHILRKLGFISRSEVSTWMTQLINTAQ
jgi:RNA polymerase sigma factor (sigma-70 family)